jgi:hypothetical protein
MGRALFALALVCSACGGTLSALPEDAVVAVFDARVQVQPANPSPGDRVQFTLEVTNVSPGEVLADVVLRVVDPDTAAHIYEQVWPSVNFKPEDIYNLTQNFLPGLNAENKPFKVQVQVKNHATQALLFDSPEIARLSFVTR